MTRRARWFDVAAAAGLGGCVVLQVVAFTEPAVVPNAVYSLPLFAAVIMLLISRAGQTAGRTRSFPRVRKVIYRIIGYEWLAWSVTFLFLISPEPGIPVQGFDFARPFSVWTLTSAKYNATYFGWLLSVASVFFSGVLASGLDDKTQDSRAAVPDKPKELPKLLRKSGLLYLFLPPAALCLLGIGLRETLLTRVETAELLISVSIFWGFAALAIVGITFIVSGLR